MFTATKSSSPTRLVRISCYRENRAPRHVVIDKADLFAPKFGTRDTARVLGAMEDLFRREG